MINSTKIIEKMQASFPHLYNVYDKKTVLYALLSTFGQRFGGRTDIIDRLYAMIGIDSTYNEDLEHRWGSLLGVYKQDSESYDDYRSRLLIVYSSLAGGTAEAIKYAIASVIGISDDIDRYIKVYDAWKYPYEVSEANKTYGHIICTIDQQSIDRDIVSMSDKILEAINNTKASGIMPYLIFIYTADEIARVLFSDNVSDIIVDKYNVATSLDIDDNFIDKTTDAIQESRMTDSRFNKSYWTNLGTNSLATLNNDLFISMHMETDACVDNIIMHTDNDSTFSSIGATFGSATFGSAIFGIQSIH